MQAFILRKKAFQISYVLRDMPEYKPIPKYFFSIIQAPLELKGSFPNDLSADCQPTDCWPQLAISLHEWFLYTYGGAALIKCFVPNAGLMHGSTWPATTSPHPPPPDNSQDKSSPLGPGVGNCLKQSCPRGMRVGQIKNNFSLILQIMCNFLRGLHEAAELKTTLVYFKGKGRRVVGEE